jgi:hypothetical protein
MTEQEYFIISLIKNNMIQLFDINGNDMEYDAYLKTEILVERANGFVATKEMAIKLAEIYLIDIYGERVKTKFPLKAILKDEIWYVIGSLPTGYDGGVPVIKISKLSGAVLGYIHFK